MKSLILVLSLFLLSLLPSIAQSIKINPDLLNKPWPASWITAPGIEPQAYGIFHFRKIVNLTVKPGPFIIHISGDNRYRLFVNGKSVCLGPARGDLDHWRFETIDISSHLQAGKNVVAAVVWNYGKPSPWSQFTSQTAFIVQGNSKEEEILNTDNSWKVVQNKAYKPIFFDNIGNLNIIGPNEEVDGAEYFWDWQLTDFDDIEWNDAILLGHGAGAIPQTTSAWKLIPRSIPLMEEHFQRLKKIRRQEGIQVSPLFLEGELPVEIPAHTKAVILLDQGVMTTAYPYISLSKGEGSKVTLSYAESLADSSNVWLKGNRDEIDHKKMSGVYDIYRPDGSENRIFSTLWFRTFRYVELKIETQDEGIKINDIYSYFTAYPLQEIAQFKSNDDSLKQIWNVGWRTARLCANEVYFDCPYYEQLQYIGDTRIQSLISLYVSGDDRLMRNAIELFSNSMNSEGLTQSRYPNNMNQLIPPFSLFWTTMIHDYWMHRDDTAFVRKYIPGIRKVLAWHEKYIDPSSGMLKAMPHWNFVDWPKEWPWNDATADGGSPPGTTSGNSSILTLQYVYALELATQVFGAMGYKTDALKYKETSEKLKSATRDLCWSKEKNLLADIPSKNIYSQHANILAVLTDLVPLENQRDVIAKTANDTSMVQATYYYRFYLHRALKKAGLGNMYTAMLGPWKDMLNIGLTTFAEKPEPTRSDCHAWSASPNYDFLSIICGVEPSSPGFKTVRIEPSLGNLKWVHGHIPHPLGEIKVSFVPEGEKGLIGEVILPQGLKGELIWKDKVIALKGGKKKIRIY